MQYEHIGSLIMSDYIPTLVANYNDHTMLVSLDYLLDVATGKTPIYKPTMSLWVFYTVTRQYSGCGLIYSTCTDDSIDEYCIKFSPFFSWKLFVELERADNGNYTCEIRSENSRVLANVTHLVIVRGKCKINTVMHPCHSHGCECPYVDDV